MAKSVHAHIILNSSLDEPKLFYITLTYTNASEETHVGFLKRAGDAGARVRTVLAIQDVQDAGHPKAEESFEEIDVVYDARGSFKDKPEEQRGMLEQL
jgi:hypothetical protein